MSIDIPLIDISVQPIELCKLLKIANMVSGGGEAKMVISEGYVLVNNGVEFQKRKKLYHNDIVEFNGEVFQVNYLKEKLTPSMQKKSSSAPEKNSKSKSLKSGKDLAESSPISVEQPKAKRKPISF